MSMKRIGLWNAGSAIAAGLLVLLQPGGVALALPFCDASTIENPELYQCTPPDIPIGVPKAPGEKCLISGKTKTWISENTDVRDASTNLSNIITGLGTGTSWPATGAYSQLKFGTVEKTATANREEARNRFNQAQLDLTTLLNKIAGSADETCYKCYLLNDWWIVKTAASFIRNTSLLPTKVGVAKLGSPGPVENTVVLEGTDANQSVTTASKQLVLGDLTTDMMAMLKVVNQATKKTLVDNFATDLCEGLFAGASADGTTMVAKARLMQNRFNNLLKTPTLWGTTSGTNAMSTIEQAMTGNCVDTAFYHRLGDYLRMCEVAGIKKP